MTAFPILLLFAVIFLIAGGALLYFRQGARRKAALINRTETSNASDIPTPAPGTLVEVRGSLRCEQPLESEMARERCAYYSAAVTREYVERDSNGNDVGPDRRSGVVAHNEQFAPFCVEDATGSVPVDAEGAEVDARQVVNRFERNTGGDGPSVSPGGTTIDLGGGERTLGYRYTERLLPVNTPVYVLGTVREGGRIGASPTRRRGAAVRRQPPLQRGARGESGQDGSLARRGGGGRARRGGRASRDRGRGPRGLSPQLCRFSKIPAAPMPPPMHMVTMP